MAKYTFILLASLAAAVPAGQCAEQTSGSEWSTARLSREICGEDDWSPFNRCMFGIEDAIITYLGCPVCWVYGSIVPKPLVKGIYNAVENIEYPIRLFSTLFRAEWGGAWDETCRFCINSTVGIGGLFDPAQNMCGIFSTHASMSGTFATWGIPKGKSLILPFVPRANLRDDIGYGVDTCFDPKTYFDIFFPTGVVIGWTAAFWPNYGEEWIDLWEETFDSQADPYAAYRQLVSAHTFLNEDLSVYRYMTDLVADKAESRRPPVRAALQKPADLHGRWRDLANFEPRTPALDAFRIRLFKPERDDDFWWMRHSIFNDDFAREMDERTVTIATNRPAAHYGFIAAPTASTSRLVFVIPGIGGTHDAKSTLAMAEFIHNADAAVVVCDDPFHWQFMMSANDALLPGNLPEDAKHYAAFIRAVLADLKADGLADDPEVSIVGWSMGALVTCHLAALETRGQLGFRTGRFLAVNPPVAYDSIEKTLDGFLAPSRGWTAAEAKANFVEITRRLLFWEESEIGSTPDISEADAAYGVAIALGATLPTLIACTTQTNADVSVRDYFCRYVNDQYPQTDLATLARQAGLLSLEKEFRANSRLRMIHTRDDFLLSETDRAYLDRTLGDRLTWFSAGSHCGMFHTPEFKDEVLKRLALKAE